MEEKKMENPKIYAAIAGVIADCGFVAKDKVNKQQGFKYRSVDDVFNALHPALAKNKVFIVPRILERTCDVAGKTKTGATMVKVVCKIKFTFYGEDGSYVESVIVGEGLDTGDKATNKAMAVAYKYACFQVFCIPTEEMADPDSESLEEEALPDQKAKEPAVRKTTETKKNQETQRPAENEQITQAMLNTIRSEQKRKRVADAQILSMKAVKAKKIEDMTVTEFDAVMKRFEVTPEIKTEEAKQNE